MMEEGQIEVNLENAPDDLANVKIKEVTFEAVVTRADGTVEDLGVIAHYVNEEEG